MSIGLIFLMFKESPIGEIPHSARLGSPLTLLAMRSRHSSEMEVEPMPNTSVLCLAKSSTHADQIVGRLKTTGFSNHGISALFPNKDSAHDLAREKSARKQRREQLPALPRAAWWVARQGGFASIGAVAIPGVGPIVAAGPILFTLSGTRTGNSSASIAEGLIGMGISEFDARRYEGQIKEGHIMISVLTDSLEEVTLAKEIFERAGAHHICATDETSPNDNLATERVTFPQDGLSSI